MKNKLTFKIALRGLLIALAFVLSWVEMQLPYFFAIPGIKLGLTNLVVLLALYKLSSADAFVLNIIRILLVSITFGNPAALPYSLAGGILSFVVMLTLKNYTAFSMRFVSVSGAIAHNAGQIIVAMAVLESTKIAYYLPFLWIAGILAGIVIGLICEFVTVRLPDNL